MSDATHQTTLGRRAFLGLVPAVLAAPSLLGCADRTKAGGTARSDTQAGTLPALDSLQTAEQAPRIAIVGCGGRGADNLGELLAAGANVVALCDVDQGALERAKMRDPQKPLDARMFRDLREVFARRRELKLDGVLVSTPDHTHAFATALALRAGLPVYCEKPLTHSLAESRRILELARTARVPTQMGTQIHATENYRRVVELVRAGVIGEITSCDCWVNKGWCCGPTGPVVPPPATLDYDLWLGPAQAAPYVDQLHPANWRKYWAFGTGTLGDMGCHMLDLPVWALGLDRASMGTAEIYAQCSSVDSVACPEWTEASWAVQRTSAGGAYRGLARFGGAPSGIEDRMTLKDPLVLRWFDNGRMSPLAQELGGKDRQDYHGRFNIAFQGTKGFLFANYGEFLVLPKALADEPKPAITAIPPSPGHHREWLDAIRAWRAGAPDAFDAPLCAFERSTVLNDVVLSGTVAARAGGRINYDFVGQRFVSADSALDPERFWTQQPRDGWSLSDADLDAVLRGA